MTYPEISPDLKIKSTISHPLRPEEVIGFIARNKMLGRPAVVMKLEALNGTTVQVPEDAAEELTSGDGELVVLYYDEVLTMGIEDFYDESRLRTVEGRGKTAKMQCVEKGSDSFLSWDESMVEISN